MTGDVHRILPTGVTIGVSAVAGILLAVADAGPLGWVLTGLWLLYLTAALFALSDPDARQSTLRLLAGPGSRSGAPQVFDRLWADYGGQVAGTPGPATFVRAALNWRLYDAAMLFAVLYPILVTVLWWTISGSAVHLGDTMILPAAAFWPTRATPLAGLVLAGICLPLGWWVAALPEHRRTAVMRWLPVLAGSVASVCIVSAFDATAAATGLAIGVLAATAIAGSGAITVVGAPALVALSAVGVATASTLMQSGLGPIATVVGIVTLVIVTVDTLDSQNRQGRARWLVSIVLPVAWVAALNFITWPEIGERARGIFLFLAVFPLLYAAFSALAFGITLGLFEWGRRTGRRAVAIVVSVIVAFAAMLALGIALALTVALLDQAAGAPVFLASTQIDDILIRPIDHVWLGLSVLSPMALLVALACIALPRRLGAGLPALRRHLADQASSQNAWRQAMAPLELGTFWAIPSAAVLVVGWGIWAFSAPYVAAAASAYVDAVGILLWKFGLV